MGFIQGDWIPHPNSLLFNAFPGFWPLKAFWFFRKVSCPLPNSQHSLTFVCFSRHGRLASSSCCKTSQLRPRATPTNRDLASTSASRCTEHDEMHRPCTQRTSTCGHQLRSVQATCSLCPINYNNLRTRRPSATQRADQASVAKECTPRAGYLIN